MGITDDSRIDLHIHTNHSDGNWSYGQVFDEAKKRGIKLLSIADHDVISDYDELRKCSRETQIAFISGVEFSTILDGDTHHVLGYGFDWNNPDIRSLMQQNLTLEASNNKDRDEIWFRDLKRMGYTLDAEEFGRFGHGAEPVVGKQFRAKIIDYAVYKNICVDAEEFLERLLPNLSPIELPDFPHPGQVVNAIKRGGGTAVLAHPIHAGNSLSAIDTVELFKELQIEGIECYYSGAASADSDYCHDWCKNNNLLITGGSGSHGDRIAGREIGVPEIRMRDLFLGGLKERIYYPPNAEG